MLTGTENEKLQIIRIPTIVGDGIPNMTWQCVFQNEHNEGNKISVHSKGSYT